MISDTQLGAGLALASMSMFSANILLTRMAMARLRLDVGFLIAVTVNVVFGALLFGIGLALRTQPLAWDPTAFWLFMLSGVFTTYLGRWFFFETVARLGPARQASSRSRARCSPRSSPGWCWASGCLRRS